MRGGVATAVVGALALELPERGEVAAVAALAADGESSVVEEGTAGPLVEETS